MACGEDDARLLGRCDAGRCAAITLVATQTYLDENQCFAVAADKIDLSTPAAEILRQYLQAMARKESRSQSLSLFAARVIVVAH